MGSSADTVKFHDTLADTTKVLHKDETGPPHNQSWNNQADIGCLNYLQAMTLNPCHGSNTNISGMRLWVWTPIHLFNMRECEVICTNVC